MPYSEEFNKLFRLSTVPLLLATKESYIIDVNPAFCYFLDYLREELIGLNVTDDLTHPDDKPLSRKVVKNIVEFSQFQKRYIKRDKSIVWARVTVIDMGEDFLAIVENVSDLKDLTKKLDITSADLQKMFYIVSHDLQEPIRTVNNCLELLDQEIDFHSNQETDEIFNLMKNNLDWMKKLINSLLFYSRIGSATQNIVDINIERIVDRVKEALDTVINEKQAKILYTCNYWIKMDEVHATSLFQNIIHNALKYSDEPIVKITCKEDNNYVQFCIEDNGIGIDKKHYETIFLIFKRLDKTMDNGTGIGLASCKRIVEIYNGEIWVESEPKKGSKFYFTLPKGKLS
jgi:PAS domain S-box-containing protein